MIYNIYMT